MNTKKILAMVIAHAMDVAMVPAFGLVASAADDYIVGSNGLRYVVGTDNLVVNGTFDDGMNNMTSGNFDTPLSEANGFSIVAEVTDGAGNTRTNVLKEGNGQGSGSAGAFATKWAVTPGSAYYIAYDQRRDGSISHNGGIRFLKEDGATTVSSLTIDHVLLGDVKIADGNGSFGDNAAGNYVFTTTTLWSRKAYMFIVPDDAAYVGLQMSWTSDTYLDNIELFEATAIPTDASVKVNYVLEDGTPVAEGVAEDVGYTGDTYTYVVATTYYVDEATATLYEIAAPEEITLAEGENVVNVVLTPYRKIVGENLAVNGDLETGDFTGWTVDEFTVLAVVEESGSYVIDTSAASMNDATETLNYNITAPATADYYIAVDAKGTTGDHPTYQYMRFIVDGTDLNTDTMMYFSTTEYVTTQYISSVDEGDIINFTGTYFKDAHPYIDNYTVYQLAPLDTQQVVDAVVNYVYGGEVVATASLGQKIIGEEAAAPAGVFAPQYYLDAAVTATVPEDGVIEVEVDTLDAFTFRTDGAGIEQVNGSYNGANMVNWGSAGRGSVIYITVPEYDAAVQALELSLTGRFNNGNGDGASPSFPIIVTPAADVKAIDLTQDANTTQAALEATTYTLAAESGDFAAYRSDYTKPSTPCTVVIALDDLAAGEYAIVLDSSDATASGIFVATAATVAAVDAIELTYDVTAYPRWNENAYELVFEATVSGIPAGMTVEKYGFEYAAAEKGADGVYNVQPEALTESVTDGEATNFRLIIKDITGANALRTFYAVPTVTIGGEAYKASTAFSAELITALVEALEAETVEVPLASDKAAAFATAVPVLIRDGEIKSLAHPNAAAALAKLYTYADGTATVTELAKAHNLYFTTATVYYVDGAATALTGDEGTNYTSIVGGVLSDAVDVIDAQATGVVFLEALELDDYADMIEAGLAEDMAELDFEEIL